jgi:diaminohydroxyphosphoribosylaminopyrimidine deaminase/5-amino-6-(5-phosphoribosylamino)uracil reductase
MENHEKYIQRCFDIARSGLGKVSPNPLVGCVIVWNEKIIGEGYHGVYGGPHAEVNAVQSVKDPSKLKESTLYVNLEPCCHQGKTPACTELILKHKIPRVVISTIDVNPEVNGRGIQGLKRAGVEVLSGILEEEGKELNLRFFTFHKQHRPYIILKWAQTLDGFIDVDRTDPDTPIKWISNDKMKLMVHKWRCEEDAIIVGFTTALNDNPQLNIREWYGRNPLRLVLDENLTLPKTHHLLDRQQPTVIFTSKEAPSEPNLEFITLDFKSNIIAQINNVLYNRGIGSLIVEGGRELLDTYLEYHCWDEARVIEGNQYFGKGLKGPDFKGTLVSSAMAGSDRLLLFKNRE